MRSTVSKFTKWLVTRSALLLIEDSERYAEQWLADLEDRGTPLRKLLFAFGLWRASRELRQELEKVPLHPFEVAAEWIVRSQDAPLRVDQRLRFVAWLKESPEHVAAWWKIELLLQELRNDCCLDVSWKCQEEMDRTETSRTDEGDKGS